VGTLLGRCRRVQADFALCAGEKGGVLDGGLVGRQSVIERGNNRAGYEERTPSRKERLSYQRRRGLAAG